MEMKARVAPKSSDPKEQRLRELWHQYKAESENGDPRSVGRFHQVHNELAKYLWDRVEREVAADRARHPKAKRNAPVGSESGGGGGRVLP